MGSESSETAELLARASRGDPRALESLLIGHRPRLRRMVAARLDERLRRRIDPSDVIQETFLEVSARLPAYLRDPSMPFFLWLRFLTGQKLVTLHRYHLGTRMRDAGQEAAPGRGGWPQASSFALADHLLDSRTGPSEAAMRAERKDRVRRALEGLDPLDREALSLRHLEQLSRAEIAAVLGISEAAAGKRYIRALEKLRQHLDEAGEGLTS